MQRAYLIGLAHYPHYTLAGVANDLALIKQGLQQQGFDPANIQIFGMDSGESGKEAVIAGTRADLEEIFLRIRADFAVAAPASATDHCFFYFGGSGMLALDPLRGGLQPTDGDPRDFQSALSFAALNCHLPVRSGSQVTVVLDC